MFGYVKPVSAELFVKEHEFYRATYCGVCRALVKHTGMLSNVLHSYDSVFLALVRMLYIDGDKIGTTPRRCIAHPAHRRSMLDENEALEYTARAFGILTYYKLCDDMADESFVKKLSVGMIKPIYSSAKRRANLEELAGIIKERLESITALEKAKCKSVDEGANLFGDLLGEIFAYNMQNNDRLVLFELGKHLGRFIYSADAAEDYDSDRRRGKYNPYVLMYDGAELTYENKQSIKSGLICICQALERAVNLLPFGEHVAIENIIKNIIYLGLTERISFLDKKDGDSETEK